MIEGRDRDCEGLAAMTQRQPLPRAQEWKREDTISMANHGRRLLKEILENNLDDKTTLKKIGLAIEAFSQITILWMDMGKEKQDDRE